MSTARRSTSGGDFCFLSSLPDDPSSLVGEKKKEEEKGEVSSLGSGNAGNLLD